MRKTAVLAFVVLLAAASAPAQTEAKAAGHWQGKVQLPSRDIELVVDLDRTAKGAWIGSISVTGTTAVDVPLSGLTVDGAAVVFSAALGEKATFKGKLSEDGNTLSGTASNSAGEAPFQFTRAGEAKVKLPSASTPLTKEFEGAWEGTVTFNGGTLRVGLQLASAADGLASARLISYDQNNAEFAADSVTIEGKQLQFDVRSISGTYKGTLGANGEIAGEWKQGAGASPLTFKRPAAKP